MPIDCDAMTGWRRAASLLALVLLVIWCASAGIANAQEPVTAAVHAQKGALVGDSGHTRLLLRFDRKPDTKWFLLRDPHRLVVDFESTLLELDAAELKPVGMVKHVRYGNISDGRSRMILAFGGPFKVEKVEVSPAEEGGFRLIADIAKSDAKAFEADLRRHMDTAKAATAVAEGAVKAEEKTPGPKKFTVVIDAGHGGIDGGAQGVSGINEKTITLAFALELRKKLEAIGDFDVVMSRDKDVYLSLDERVELARAHAADLFISIHADAIGIKSVRGATIYTVSDRASDATAALTAARENLSDTLAGIEVAKQKSEVADILLDLIRRETHSFSIRFARSLLDRFSDTITMIHNPHRYAGFRVLRAPDVPSVLIELGYLSNPKDEKELRSAEWRSRTADCIVEAVQAFAANKSGAGG